ncbi:MAG: hypothetical protein MUC88_03880 [Planctomycetes bacterium]|jgi:hypothetical protein|nr:hypothetical protein [Planctomycetota bacterium]
MPARQEQTIDKQSTPLGILARLWWMLIGNVLLAFSLIFIYRREGGFLHAADGVFWVTVASLVLVRYLDIRYLNGQTPTGQPASLRDWNRYVILLPAAAAAVWILVHAANRLLAGQA